MAGGSYQRLFILAFGLAFYEEKDTYLVK